MKKIISILMAAVMLFSLCGLTGCNKNDGKIEIVIESQSVSAGESVTFPVKINNANLIKNYGNGSLAALQFKLRCDSNALTPVSASGPDTDDGSQWLYQLSEISTDGTYMVMIYDNNLVGISPDQKTVEIANITFRAGNASGEFTVSPELVDICDTDAGTAVKENVVMPEFSVTIK